MRLIDWILALFRGVSSDVENNPRSVKFVEGTEWTCPKCDTVMGVAKRDLFSGEVASYTDWHPKVPQALWTRMHCGVYTIRSTDGIHEIHTPTGWVG